MNTSLSNPYASNPNQLRTLPILRAPETLVYRESIHSLKKNINKNIPKINRKNIQQQTDIIQLIIQKELIEKKLYKQRKRLKKGIHKEKLLPVSIEQFFAIINLIPTGGTYKKKTTNYYTEITYFK